MELRITNIVDAGKSRGMSRIKWRNCWEIARVDVASDGDTWHGPNRYEADMDAKQLERVRLSIFQGAGSSLVYSIQIKRLLWKSFGLPLRKERFSPQARKSSGFGGILKILIRRNLDSKFHPFFSFT